MRHYLGARTRRSPGIKVFVPLSMPESMPEFMPEEEGETVFVESGGEEPEGYLWILRRDSEGQPRRAEAEDQSGDLATLLDILWPAGGEALEEGMRSVLATDNRVDLEEELIGLVELVEAILAWWSGERVPARASLLRPFIKRDPALHSLFQLDLGADLIEFGRHRQRSPREAWPTLVLGDGDNPPRADETAWEAWKERDPVGIFGPRGGLANLLDGRYEMREGQLQMSEATARVLDRQEHLMVEAGTGIGKSLAYLVPTLLHGARSGERVVISTHTKALQQQLVAHDLPLLQRLGYPGRVRLLLGRNNYLCRRQLRHAIGRDPKSAEEARARLTFVLWAQQSISGRREELSGHRWMLSWWNRWFDSVEPCSPHICHPAPSCFVVRARRAAREAAVVVVNHSLLMMDLKSGQGLMGPSRILVVDEAHQLAPVATRALSHWLGRDRLEVYNNLAGEGTHDDRLREVPGAIARAARGSELEKDVRRAAQSASEGLDRFQRAFRSWIEAVEDGAAERLGSHRKQAGSHRYHDATEAFGGAREEGRELLESAGFLDRAVARLLASAGDLEDDGEDLSDEREGLASMLEFHRDWCASIRFCLDATDEDWVFWFEWGGEKGLAGIVAAPLTVEDPLATLWDEHFDSVIMTSATLAVADDFTPFAEGVGFSRVSRFTDSLLVPSPFRHEEQALLLTSLALPDPKDPSFAPLVADVVARIATAVSTKTMVLSTSYAFLRQMSGELERRLAEERSRIFDEGRDPVEPLLLVQEPGSSRPALIERFRRAEAAILLATGAFWEGMDFPGRELELLVVPRLPFSVPTEPVTEGKAERARRLGRDPFQDVALVDAVLRLKQGVGRLLRTEEDRGVVLLLDQRLQSRSYGVTFLKSLPRSCELEPDLPDMAERVIEFLAEGPVSRRGRMR